VEERRDSPRLSDQMALQLRLAVSMLAILVGFSQGKPSGSSGNDPGSACGSCAPAGEFIFGLACGDTEYTLRLGNLSVSDNGMLKTLPSPEAIRSSIATQCDISAERVNCTAWKPGTNDIDCKVRDERGVHSATYMLRHMARQAGNGNLMLAGAHVDRWRMTWDAEVNSSEDDPIYSLISFAIMIIIIAPFLFYKIMIEETYNDVSSRDKRRQQAMIRQDNIQRSRRGVVKKS